MMQTWNPLVHGSGRAAAASALLFIASAAAAGQTGEAPRGATGIVPESASARVDSPLLILAPGSGREVERLSGDGVTSAAIRERVAAASGPSFSLVLRADGQVRDGQPVLQLGPEDSDTSAFPIADLLGWLDQSPAEKLLVVIDTGDESQVCQFGDMDRRMPSKPRLALICSDGDSEQPSGAATATVAELAAHQLMEQSQPAASGSLTAFGLLADLDARASAGSRLVGYLRGRDWPLSEPSNTATADVTAEEKLDTDLRALAQPDLDAAGLDRSLAKLEAAGVVVRREPTPAVTVRVTALSVEQASAVRAQIEQAGGEVSVGFENTLFALIPLAELRRLAGLEAVWLMEVNRPTLYPMSQ